MPCSGILLFMPGFKLNWKRRQNLLLFENEHQLGTKPKEIDVLIVKKERDVSIRKNIGRIFRTHNIVEYKSPKDYLSVDDFYKADTAQADSIAIHDITITFVCHRYPRSLMRHLTDELEETEMAKRLIEQYGKA